MFTTPSNVLPLHLKQTFPPIIWIFIEGEGDGIKSRLPFKIFFTLLGLIYFCSLVRLACLLISSQDFSNGFSRSHLRLGEKSTKKAPVWKLVCSASNICLLILDPTYVLRLKCQECNSVLGNSEFSCNDLKFFKHPKIFIFDESNTCNNDWNSSLFQEINILNF